MTHADRVRLLRIYRVAFHTENKIEGASSCDSSCNGCGFCEKMREAAEKDPTMICAYCYDAAQEARWVNTENRHKLNMLIMMSVDFEEDELVIINVTEITRVNSSGDCPNTTYARNMFRIAKVNAEDHFTFWAKNHAPVQQACRELGKPANMILIKSSIRIGIVDELPEFFDYVFTVYMTEEDTLAAIRDGANPCNGKKCKDCGWKCYYGTHTGNTNIAEKLRAPKKVIDALLKRRN